MTYCCGILVRDGLVMIADTRTNAGLDNVSTFRKLHVFSKPGERIMAIASAGNLAISQSVLSTLTEGIEDPTTGEVETLMNIRVAQSELKVVEVPSYEHSRLHGTSNLNAWRDGKRVLRTILAERIRPR